MVADRIDPSDQIPEADLFEQTAIAPRSLIDTESPSEIFDSPEHLVDEADRLEQQTPVPGEDEDDYPRGP